MFSCDRFRCSTHNTFSVKFMCRCYCLTKYLQIPYNTSCCNRFKLLGHIFLAYWLKLGPTYTVYKYLLEIVQCRGSFIFIKLTLKCFIFIYQLITSKNGAFNKHDNNVVCCTGMGGLICNAITFIKLLHRNCYHATIFSIYYIHCQKLNNNLFFFSCLAYKSKQWLFRL